MSLSAAFIMIAQANAAIVAEAPRFKHPSAIASVRASARVLRAQPIRIVQDLPKDPPGLVRESDCQRGRDAAGTVWIEFS